MVSNDNCRMSNVNGIRLEEVEKHNIPEKKEDCKIQQTADACLFKAPDGTSYTREELAKLVKKKWHVKTNPKYPDGDSPLHYSCRHAENNKWSTHFLISHMPSYGIGSMPKNQLGQNLLHAAAMSKDPEVFRLALAKCRYNSGVFAFDKENQMALYTLVENNDFLSAARLIFHTPKNIMKQVFSVPGKNPFGKALKNQNNELATLMVALMYYVLGENHELVQRFKTEKQFQDLAGFFKQNYPRRELFRTLMDNGKRYEERICYLCSLPHEEPLLFTALLPSDLDDTKQRSDNSFFLTREKNNVCETVMNRGTSCYYEILLKMDFDAADHVKDGFVQRAALRWKNLYLWTIYLQKITKKDSVVTKLCLDLAKGRVESDPTVAELLFNYGLDIHKHLGNNQPLESLKDSRFDLLLEILKSYKDDAQPEIKSKPSLLKKIFSSDSEAPTNENVSFIPHRPIASFDPALQKVYQAVFNAAEKDNFSNYIDNIRKFQDPNVVDGEGKSLLQRAVQGANRRIIVDLLVKGADINFVSHDGVSVLKTQPKERIVPLGYNLNEFLTECKYCLEMDVNSGEATQLLAKELQVKNSFFLDLFIKRKFRPNDECYKIAIQHQDFAHAKELLKTGWLPSSLCFELNIKFYDSDEYKFAKEWLNCIDDPINCFNLAKRIGYQPLIDQCFHGVLSTPISNADKILAICQGGDSIAELQKCLESGQNDMTSEQRKGAWLSSCKRNKRDFVEALHQAGWDPTIADSSGNTGLHYGAMEPGAADVLDYLFGIISMDTKNNQHQTAWDLGIKDITKLWKGHPVLFSFLKAGKQIEDVEQAKMIWELLKDEQKDVLVNKNPSFVFLAASFAKDQNYLHKVIQFSSSKIQIPEDRQIAYLKAIIKWTNPQIIELVFKSRVMDFNWKDSAGRGVVHWAAESGRPEVVSLLIATMKMDVHQQDSLKQTALQYYFHSCESYYPAQNSGSIAYAFLSEGAQIPDTLTLRGIWKGFCAMNDVQFINFLTDNDLSFPYQKGENTPLHYASEAIADVTLEYLLNMKKWDANELGESSRTALSSLCHSMQYPDRSNQGLKCLNLLLPLTTDLNAKDGEGVTPLLALCRTYWRMTEKNLEEDKKTQMLEVDPNSLYSLLRAGAKPEPVRKFYNKVYWTEVVMKKVFYGVAYSSSSISGGWIEEVDKVIHHKRKEKVSLTYNILKTKLQ